MEHVSTKDFTEMEKMYRRNLINSCTGYKSANLIATQSGKGNTNVAVFNSVFHVGSTPPLLGFLLSSVTKPANTYHNILNTGYFTVNHIQENMIEQAHQTAARYEADISEFDQTGLEKEYLDGFYAPYVKQSVVKMGCRYLNEYEIKENDTRIIIAAIEHIYFDPGIQMPDGWLRLDDAGTVAINGVDGYALPTLLDRFHYAKPGREIRSFFKEANS